MNISQIIFGHTGLGSHFFHSKTNQCSKLTNFISFERWKKRDINSLRSFHWNDVLFWICGHNDCVECWTDFCSSNLHWNENNETSKLINWIWKCNYSMNEERTLNENWGSNGFHSILSSTQIYPTCHFQRTWRRVKKTG